MASGPWNRERHSPERSRREMAQGALRIKDRQVATLREQHPGFTRAYDAEQWLAALVAAAVMQKVFPDELVVQSLSVLVETISGAGLFVNAFLMNAPAPSQWPRIVRKLRDDKWLTARGDSPE